MPDTPWMASMLGQLLDAVESDPALLARLRRLLAPPIAASPPPAPLGERPEVEWIGELTPADFRVPESRDVIRSTTAIPSPAGPPAPPPRPKADLPAVLPPPPVRGKTPPARKPDAPRPVAEVPRQPPPTITKPGPSPAPAPAPTVRPAPTTRLRPKTVSIPDVLRALPALPAPPPRPALADRPAKVAPFVVQWLPLSTPAGAPASEPARSRLAEELQRELGSATSSLLTLVSRLPADLLPPADLPLAEGPAAPADGLPSKPTGPAAPEPGVPPRPDMPAPRSERQRAAELLAGRVAVMIGGVSRPEKQESLRRELGLKELRWIGTRVHASLEPLVTAISDPEVGLVLLLIKLSSHSYGELAEPCKRRGIPLVRIPGGWGTNQLAHQILDQAGERLAALPAA